MLLKPTAIIAPYKDINKTMPMTIQEEIAKIILIGFVFLLGLTILKAIGFASLPTMNTSIKRATKKPSQKSLRRLVKKAG